MAKVSLLFALGISFTELIPSYFVATEIRDTAATGDVVLWDELCRIF